MSEEQKAGAPGENGGATDAPKEEAPKPAARFHWEQPATLVITLDLHRMPPAFARGMLLNMDDLVCSWYQEMAEIQAKKKLVRPGMAESMKSFLAKKFSH